MTKASRNTREDPSIGFPLPESREAYRRALARYWWIVALATIVAVAATDYFASSRAAIYRVDATLVVGPSDKLKSSREVIDSLTTLDRRSVVATFALFPSSRAVRARALQQLHVPRGELESYTVRTAVLPDSNVLEVSVDGPDPRSATAFANAVAEQTIAATGNIYPIYGLSILDRAVPSVAAHQSDTSRMLLAGAFFGLLVGLAAAFMVDRMRESRADHAAAYESGAE